MFSIQKALTITKSGMDLSSVKQKKSASPWSTTTGIYTGGGTYSTPTKRMITKLNYGTMEMMYFANTWVRACVDKIVKRAVSVQPIVKARTRKIAGKPTDQQKKKIAIIEDLLAMPNMMNQSFDTIRKQVFTDVLIWDAGALELVKDDKNVGIEAMYAVSGDTIELDVNVKGVFKNFDHAYIQKNNGQKVADFASNELMYLIQYPRANTVYGLSPLESLRQTVTAELFSADFNIKRFTNDATPRYAMMFEGLGIGQGGEAMKRIRQWWESELKGQPHKPILIGSENGMIKFEKLGLSNEDMQFQEYSRWLLSKIMAVYHVQPAVLGVIEVNQGRLNAAYQEEQFKKDALRPILTSYSQQFNTLALWNESNYGWRDIYLDWEGIDVIDRQKEAKIHEIYLKQGVFTINMVLKELGMLPVDWGDVPYLLNQMVPINNANNLATTPNVSKALGNNSFGDDFDLKEWIKTAYYYKKLNIPTGLDEVEDWELKEALSSLISKRNKKIKKKYSYSK